MKICAKMIPVPLIQRWTSTRQAGQEALIVKQLIRQMKLIMILLTLALVQAGATGYSQKVTIREKNASVEAVFRAIEKQTGYVFFYNNADLVNAKVSINLKGVSLTEALDRCFAGLPLTYKVIGNTIAIKKKDESISLQNRNNNVLLPAILSHKALVGGAPPLINRTSELPRPAKRRITGIVTDDRLEALPGVNILVKGAQQGTITEADGSFTIDVPDENAVLIFSFVGYISQEIIVGSRNSLKVVLITDNKALEEVVVVGYGTRKKSDLTGSVSSINGQTLENRNISSLEQGLQGQASGVQVTQGGGQPGGPTIVRIRGQNSIMGGNDPLYVIDGVPVQNSNDGNTSILASINPADIESFDILKDASAIAIYGARGSNGVILITTKRGKSGKSNITLRSSLGISNVIRKLEMLNSRQYAELANDRAVNDGVPLPFPDVDRAASVNTVWQDEIFKTAYTPETVINISGGSEKTKYFVSGDYFNQGGAIIGSKFTRGSFRLNLDQEVNNRLNISTQIVASKSLAKRSDAEEILESALGMPPVNTPYDIDGNYTPGDVLLGYPFSDSRGDNPLITANEITDNLTNSRLLANLRARYRLWDDMSVELMAGTDQVSGRRDQYKTRFVRGNPDGSAAERRTETNSYIIENLYQYNKSLSSNRHIINATLGFTWESQSSRTLAASSQGFVTDNFNNHNLGAGSRFGAPDNNTIEWDLLSFLGRVNYTVDDKYLFTISGRRDGSSRLGAGNKWGFFPSAAFAWKITNENFMANITPLSDMKLRVSWGKSGNQAISPYQSLQRYEPQQLVIGAQGTIGFAPANIGNPDLKWETTTQLDVGLDIGLLQNALTVTLDYYHKQTDDLLAVVNLPPSSGFATTLQNIGSLENKGFEFSAGADVFRSSQSFSWNINVNGSFNRNRITSLSKGADIFAPNISFVGGAHILRIGEPMSSFYGYIENGLTENGLINYADLNGDGTINVLDRKIIGSPHPDFIYGLTNTLKYKNFNFTVFIQGEEGKQLWNSNEYFSASSFYRGVNNIAEVANRWTPNNPNMNAPYPKASSALNFMASDRFVEDASYIRLKNIQLAYSLPLKGRALQSARIFVSGQNLLTFTNYSWFDPDVSSFASGDLRIGVDQGAFPITKTITFGVEIGL